jgi:hypothetical protein
VAEHQQAEVMQPGLDHVCFALPSDAALVSARVSYPYETRDRPAGVARDDRHTSLGLIRPA